MKVLLDTHVILWAAFSKKRLSRKVSALLAEQHNVGFISAASAWEIATKVRLGKLPDAEALEADFVRITQAAGYTLLPIDVKAALRAGRLAGKHGDPFDRMIAAQALALDIPVLSADTQLDQFGVQRIW